MSRHVLPTAPSPTTTHLDEAYVSIGFQQTSRLRFHHSPRFATATCTNQAILHGPADQASVMHIALCRSNASTANTTGALFLGWCKKFGPEHCLQGVKSKVKFVLYRCDHHRAFPPRARIRRIKLFHVPLTASACPSRDNLRRSLSRMPDRPEISCSSPRADVDVQWLAGRDASPDVPTSEASGTAPSGAKSRCNPFASLQRLQRTLKRARRAPSQMATRSRRSSEHNALHVMVVGGGRGDGSWKLAWSREIGVGRSVGPGINKMHNSSCNQSATRFPLTHTKAFSTLHACPSLGGPSGIGLGFENWPCSPR